MMMVENEKEMKKGLRMRIINSMIQNITEQKDQDFHELELFKSHIGYKSPIFSTKRPSRERAKAGFVDHTNTPSKI